MTWTYADAVTSDTAPPGTAASNAKAADAKSCSFIIVIDGWVVFDYRPDRFISPQKSCLLFDLTQKIFNNCSMYYSYVQCYDGATKRSLLNYGIFD